MKGLQWFNNGVVNKRCKECPEGFVPGYLRRKFNNMAQTNNLEGDVPENE